MTSHPFYRAYKQGSLVWGDRSALQQGDRDAGSDQALADGEESVPVEKEPRCDHLGVSGQQLMSESGLGSVVASDLGLRTGEHDSSSS